MRRWSLVMDTSEEAPQVPSVHSGAVGAGPVAVGGPVPAGALGLRPHRQRQVSLPPTVSVDPVRIRTKPITPGTTRRA